MLLLSSFNEEEEFDRVNLVILVLLLFGRFILWLFVAFVLLLYLSSPPTDGRDSLAVVLLSSPTNIGSPIHLPFMYCKVGIQ